jgi:hypothetical protein
MRPSLAAKECVMGYEKRADGTIVKVSRRTRLKRPKGKRAELLVERGAPLRVTVTPAEATGDRRQRG